MDFRDYYRLIRRNVVVVLICLFLGVGSAAAVTYSQTPIYETNIQLFVTTPAAAVDISALAQGSSFSQQRVKSYAQIIGGPATLDPVIEQLGLKTTSTQLAKQIKSSAPLDTVLINVTVSDPSAQRAVDIANAVGTQFSKTVDTLELAAAGDLTQAVKITMVKTAVLPKGPASPKKAINILLGIILGFGLGVGLSILRQIFDNTIKNEDHLDGTPLLAAIPFDGKFVNHRLISDLSKWAPRTEAHRKLRTNLQYLRADNPPKVISVTSAVPNEGKTVTSLNLAISLGFSGLKTLWIEGDMRRPKFQQYMHIDGTPVGLAEILSGKVTVDSKEEFKAILTSIPGTEVDVLTSGKTPPNPTELLDSRTFAKLIEYVRDRYDYVIIDSPPALLIADAVVISTIADGTLVVVNTGKTKVGQFLGVRESVLAVGGTILGAILNKVPENKVAGDYGYKHAGGYGRRYGYGGYRSRKGYGGAYSADSYKPRKENDPERNSSQVD
ncbi:MAG: polysaccharide biosynthesis tyrosine autokinase [Actinomycetes bacterium]